MFQYHYKNFILILIELRFFPVKYYMFIRNKYKKKNTKYCLNSNFALRILNYEYYY